MTAPAIAKFALKFKCQIVPALCIREKGVKYRIEYLKPITNSLKNLEQKKKILEYLNKIIESWVLSYPEQWICRFTIDGKVKDLDRFLILFTNSSSL